MHVRNKSTKILNVAANTFLFKFEQQKNYPNSLKCIQIERVDLKGKK